MKLDHPFFIRLAYTFQDPERLCILDMKRVDWLYLLTLSVIPHQNITSACSGRAPQASFQLSNISLNSALYV